ncbi:nucleotidyltransferase family protein [Xylanibacter ruminicola]|nr:nucleotidyltransferase family protein [Xylanibacter ruminicola]
MDFNEIYRLAQEQSVVGLVAAGLEHVADVKVPQAMALTIAGEVLQLEQRNSAMNQFVARLVGDMRKAGIYTLLVKGQAVAQCYEKPLWRACGDVDFFLSDDNYEKAKAFLKPMASEIEKEYVGAKHLGMTIDGWVVELHGSLRVGLPNRINRELDEIYTDTFKNGSVRSWNNNGTQILTLSKENDIVYVFVHFFNHFYKVGVGLRQICDWCRLMWTYRNEIDVKKIEERIKRMGLVSEWKAFYALASKYLGMPDVVNGSWLMIKDSRFDKKADRILEFVLKSGNMGHNRDMSHFSKKPYLVRKCVSMSRRVSDLINHARIFPMDSLRFFPRIMWNGVRSAVKGE